MPIIYQCDRCSIQSWDEMTSHVISIESEGCAIYSAHRMLCKQCLDKAIESIKAATAPHAQSPVERVQFFLKGGAPE